MPQTLWWVLVAFVASLVGSFVSAVFARRGISGPSPEAATISSGIPLPLPLPQLPSRAPEAPPSAAASLDARAGQAPPVAPAEGEPGVAPPAPSPGTEGAPAAPPSQANPYLPSGQTQRALPPPTQATTPAASSQAAALSAAYPYSPLLVAGGPSGRLYTITDGGVVHANFSTDGGPPDGGAYSSIVP